MLPTAAAPRARRALPFLLLLLLLLCGPARGNEGAAAGSCRCEKHESAPRLATRFGHKLQSCDICRDFLRFTFRNRTICGLKEAPWAVALQNAHCHKRIPGEERADASRGDNLPAPVPQTTGPAPPSPSSAAVSPGASVPTTAGSTLDPSAEAAARGGSRAPVEGERATPPPARDAKTPLIVLICVTLVSFGVAVFALCRWRQQRGGSQGGLPPQTPLGEDEEGAFCLPGEKT